MSIVSIQRKNINESNISTLLVESILTKDDCLFDEILENDFFSEEILPINILHFCILRRNVRAFLKILEIAQNNLINAYVGIPGLLNPKTPLDCLGAKPFPKYILAFLGGAKHKKMKLLKQTNIMRDALIQKNAKLTVTNWEFQKELFVEIICKEFPFLNNFRNPFKNRSSIFCTISPVTLFVAKQDFQDL